MAVKLLCLCLPLLALLGYCWAKESACLSASNCSECIQTGPECAWCNDHRFKIHCHTFEGLRKAGCQKRFIYNPQGGVQVVRNDSRTEPAEAAFLQPQELSIRLRPGVSRSFPLTLTQAAERPVTDLTLDTSPAPEGVNITFSSIIDGNPRVIQVHVEAAQCLSESGNQKNSTGPWSIQITPRGFSLSLKLELTLECQCNCSRDRVENSHACSGHGTKVCGQCECPEPYIGRFCESRSDVFSPSEEDRCRSGPRAPVCSGKGTCVEGSCECDRRVNPQERYSGMFCECSNFDCQRHNNRLCGGHGRCECGECVCDRDWSGDDCSCSLETASCLATNQQLCYGRGMCKCGQCKCEPPYTGPTCEICPFCPGTCQQHAECVECRAFGTGRKKDRCDRECAYFSVTLVETNADLPQPEDSPVTHCKMRSSDDFCFYSYTLSTMPPGGTATVVRAKECPRQ